MHLSSNADVDSEAPIECPVTHPYAFELGKSCCKTKYEDDPENQGDRFSNYTCSNSFVYATAPQCDATCDGSELSIYSNCCEDDAVLECPDGNLCIDGNENKGIFTWHYTPLLPLISRFTLFT